MITVILNVYNGEKYLPRCVDSVLEQSFQDFELILVDDGSKDKTPLLADEYTLKDARVKVYHTENKGLSGSRRFGLSKAIGDYCIFIDCDDWVEKDWLRCLYEAVEKNQADIAICEYNEVYSKTNRHIQVINRESVADYIKDLIHGRTWCVVWNKLIKTSIIKDNEINFIEKLRYWEDVPFSVSYALYCHRIAFVNRVLYNYNKTNEESLTATEWGGKMDNTAFNHCRVKAVTMIEHHMNRAKCLSMYENDLVWLKLWIKDSFIRYDKSVERVKMWRNSFPEVNSKWRIYTNGRFSILYWALQHNIYSLIAINNWYWKVRHFVKSICE